MSNKRGIGFMFLLIFCLCFQGIFLTVNSTIVFAEGEITSESSIEASPPESSVAIEDSSPESSLLTEDSPSKGNQSTEDIKSFFQVLMEYVQRLIEQITSLFASTADTNNPPDTQSVSTDGQSVEENGEDTNPDPTPASSPYPISISNGVSSVSPAAISSSKDGALPANEASIRKGSANGFPEKVFAPYVDVMLYPTFSIVDCNKKTNQKYYILAFMTAANGGLAWGGIDSQPKDFLQDQISKLRETGGDVIISFGGAMGQELATAVSDPVVLEAKYQEVIERYKLKWIDFDIEGAAVTNKAANKTRSSAIKALQSKNADLKVSFTLPVLPSGLTQDGEGLLKTAMSNGARIDVVNLMAMDYGDVEAPPTKMSMGKYAAQAAESTYNQCKAMGMDTKIGITPMIGVNDCKTEIFTKNSAKELLDWAQKTSYVSLLSMWSATRDNGKLGKLDSASPTSSSLVQNDFDFTNIFKAFK